MRTPSIKQSNLRYPLNDIFGSPALVRLMRVLLYDIEGPVSVTDAAKMTGLSQAGARKALSTLDDLSVAKRIGTGRALKYGQDDSCPYLNLIWRLFEMEHKQYTELINLLRNAVSMPEVLTAWIPSMPVQLEKPLQLNVIAEVKSFKWITRELRTRLINIEKQYNRLIELSVYSRADNQSIPNNANILWGMNYKEINKLPNRKVTPDESKMRSLKVAEYVSDLIKKNPSLINRALHYLKWLLSEDQGMANRDIAEWRQLLETYSKDQVRKLLVSDSSRSERLRRSMPFLAVLDQEERNQLFKLTDNR